MNWPKDGPGFWLSFAIGFLLGSAVLFLGNLLVMGR